MPMASTDATGGIGINVQPKTRQIAPVEFNWIQHTWVARRVAILAGQSTSLAAQAGTVNDAAVMKRLRRVTGFRGATGPITINPASGDRRKVAVAVLTVDAAGRCVLAPG
jgi:hypothetical protein